MPRRRKKSFDRLLEVFFDILFEIRVRETASRAEDERGLLFFFDDVLTTTATLTTETKTTHQQQQQQVAFRQPTLHSDLLDTCYNTIKEYRYLLAGLNEIDLKRSLR